jgi:ABC-2 type transport system ATP-binding protein
MIEVRGLTKRFGDTLAVDDLSFSVPPGVVTGFLGPNGAGKSTTMRIILGLDRPTRGTALINGRTYRHASQPMREVGALLDAKDVHGGRSARTHLRALAQSNGIPAKRVDEVLALVGLESVARKRIKGFSLGMSQRLGIAATMLGDPQVLLFDEPVNGLDPEGIQWIRNFMKQLAGEGRTVFVSSHLMSEMALTADHLVVIGRGRLIADISTKEFIAGGSSNHVRVRTPHEEQLVTALSERGVAATHVGNYLEVRGVSCDDIGDLAAERQVTIHELFQERASLEEAFMELTRDSVEYQAPGEHESGQAAGITPEVNA